MLAYLCLGLVVGMRHALEADHVSAVISLATRGGSMRRQAAQGFLWGLGHTVTLLAVAGACIGLGWTIPPSWERSFEGLVGAVLVLLGVSVFVRLFRGHVHVHGHRHADGTVHVHAHAHEERGVRDPHGHVHVPLQALLVGAAHGLAGSAALVLVVAGSARSTYAGLVYVALFGVGSIVGMMALAAAVAVPLGASARRPAFLFTTLCTAAGSFSLYLGATRLLAFAIGPHS